MIRCFDLDEPGTEIELRPDTLVQPIDLMHYLERNALRFVGAPKQVQEVPITDAMVVETGHDDDAGATVIMRVRTQSESARANAAH